MISFFRRLINSRWGAVFALIFVVLLGVGFTLSDVTGNGFGVFGGSNVAHVGGKAISEKEFDDALKRRLKAERQQNPTMDMAQFVQSGGFDATLDQLIDVYALEAVADKYGVSVGKRLIDSEIRNLPGMTGLDGKFSEEAFAAFLQEVDASEQEMRAEIYRTMMAQQVLVTVRGGPQPSDSYVLPYASLQLERRSGQVAQIASSAYLPKNPPSESVLAQYYKTNAAKFTIPEKRAISYALLDSSAVAAKAVPSEADIAAYYMENQKNYAASESRDLTQAVVPTEAAAKALAARVTGGESLDAGAKALGLSASTVTGATKQSLTTSASAAVANAVFATQSGTVATPARGQLGWYVIRVNSIKAVAARTLDAVKGEISKELEAKRREEMLADLTADIEDAFAEGNTIADVAKTYGLKVETTPKMFGNGQVPSNQAYQPIPEMKAIIPAAFQGEKNGNGQLVELVPGQRFAMVAVAEYDEAAPPALSDPKVHALVSQQWALAEGAKAARAAAEKVRKAVDGGKPLAEALADAGVPVRVEPLAGIRSDLDNREKPAAPPLSLMFAMKKGTAKLLQGSNNSAWYVVKLDQIIPGDARGNQPLLDERKGALTNNLQQEYAQQFVGAAKKEVGVEKDEDALAAMRKRLTSRDGSQ